MNKKDETNVYFLELVKKELPWLNCLHKEHGIACDNFVIEGFKLIVNHSINLRTQNVHDLSLSDVNRILLGRLNLPEDRVYTRKTGIAIYPPLHLSMSAPKHALWQLDVIQELSFILGELKKD